jgi:hemerythrin-like domain-containing protein
MPMKRDPSLVPLSHDHHHGLVRVFEIRQALRQGESLSEQQAKNAAFLQNDLAPHFQAEELHLVPLLRQFDVVEPLAIEQLLEDHRQLTRLARAATASDLDAFADLLERHIRREEREIFPAYQERVGADDRERAGAAIKATLGR